MRSSFALRASAIGTALLVLLAVPSLHAQETRYGAPAPLGAGTVRTYLTVDAEGRPLELGVALSETALEELPELADQSGPEATLPIDLSLPEGHPTPFRFVNVGWNPRGHPPVDVYTLPHFDVHFYLVDPDVRDAFVTTDPADVAELEARGSRVPGEGFMPAAYIYPGEATVPQMGGHWIDPASHEFHGRPLDMTFIYGTWDGQLVFAEPMIAKAFLESRPDATVEIATPARYAAAGWYPSAYRVAWDAAAKEHRIALTGFAERE